MRSKQNISVRRLNRTERDILVWILDAGQGDCIFGARHYTKPARLTLVGVRGVSGESAVCAAFEFAEEREAREILFVDCSDFENAVGADFDAVAFSFAGVAVNHWAVCARGCSTFFTRTVGILCGAASFLRV
jgi:hypothetical protein